MSIPFDPVSDSGRLDRRSFLLATGSLAAAAAWSSCATGPTRRQPKFSDYPFQLGVASGDPFPTGVVLWTRLAPRPLEGGGMPQQAVEVAWQIAEDESMGNVVKRGTVAAVPEWAHAVHVEVEGLRPDRWYWYQFKAGGEVSPRGRTRTLPAAGSRPEELRFTFASCQHYETGFYTAYEHMVRESPDLVVFLGDYIYEGAGQENRIRRHPGEEVVSLEDYRNRYALYKSDPALQVMHAAAPWLVTWDDHEVDNNYANAISEEPSVGRDALLRRRADAYKAYYEHMPLRRAQLPQGPDMKLYRRVAFGDLADFFVLDTRQYRTDQPCGDGNKAPCAESLDPNNTLLGRPQRQWLLTGLARSRARWNVLAQQVMMARVDRKVGEEITHSMDQWPGYEMERRRLLQFLSDRSIDNTVVLTGDIHSNWANELIADFGRLESQSVATEFVGTSISSGGDGAAEPRFLPQLLTENPFVKFHNAERGYVRCSIKRGLWQTDYRTVPYVTRPDAPINTRASFVVESGRPNLQRA